METTTNIAPSVFVKMVLDTWHSQNGRMEKLVNSLTDEQIATETAPGRNTGTYILGHLVAVNDRLFESLGWGERLHPELDQQFLFTPDAKDGQGPTIPQLRQYWAEVNEKVEACIAATTAADWFTRHNSVNDDDFAKEPHRNKLNLLLSRAVHTSNHLGQMTYLAEKK